MRSRFQLSGSKVAVIGALFAVVIVGAAIAGDVKWGDSKSERWGVIDRNTIGSPVAMLRDGPYSMTTTGISEPPFGKGSLGIAVANGTEKASFGNEVDFVGNPVASLTAVGYYVYRTGEDVGYGGVNNLPNIIFEIDPNLTATSSNYSSMVWNPDGSGLPVNQWSPYVDATTNGQWWFTGAAGAATGCNQTTMCSFAAAQLALTNGTGATILSVAISKGRDNQFQGAVDGLRLNDKAYDFEAKEVKSKGA